MAAEDGPRVLIDLTPFVLRDGHGAAAKLRETRQGTYRVDTTRSAMYQDWTRNFPDNTEIEVSLTLTGESPGGFVRGIAPAMPLRSANRSGNAGFHTIGY